MNLEAAKICYTVAAFSRTKYFMTIGKIEKKKKQIQVLGVGMLLRKAATCSTPVNITFLYISSMRRITTALNNIKLQITDIMVSLTHLDHKHPGGGDH